MKKLINSSLFPYVYLASKHLSSRAISEYLSNEKNVQVSYSTVSVALRKKDEFFEIITRKISTCVQDWLDYRKPIDATVIDVLYKGNELFVEMMNDQSLIDHLVETGIDILGSVRFIEQEWHPLPDEFKNDCLPYFVKLLREKNEHERDEI